MRILFVTSEAYPLAKTGGLADVSRALPAALMRQRMDVRVLMPGYQRALLQLAKPRIAAKLAPTMGVSDALLIAGHFPDSDLPVWLVDCPALFGRSGGLYQDENGKDWPDNARRFAFLAHVAAQIALGRTGLGWEPDLVHANDWHTGLLPLLLAHAEEPRPRTVFTAHNMAFQGNFAPQTVPALPGGESAIEFFGNLSFLQAGLRFADRVTTVSPTYAREILSEEFGCGMDGVLRQRGRDFSGVLNGIDETIWNPASDPWLPQNYRLGDFAGKHVCKRELQRELGLDPAPDTPLIGYVSRLTGQKMADTVIEAIPWIIRRNAQLAVVGEGCRDIETALQAAQERHPARLSVTIGYDEPLAHKLQAASDILLAPARFEPCGLTQLYAMRYGTLPVVRRTGGLADTVTDADARTLADRSASGFVFEEATAAGLVSALARALAVYREPLQWRIMQLQAMSRDFSWNRSAAAYIVLYQELTKTVPQIGIAVEGIDDDAAVLRAAG